ncbi:MAG: globin [Acidimicrobiales bacterium]
MEESIFDQLGGEAFFVQLVDTFYAAVERDDVLRPMYPDDLTDSKRHFTMFLIQYWGGPRTYQDERGHPRLRIRHAPFEITKSARDAWLRAMNGALDSVRDQLNDEQFEALISYFQMAATQLRNA